jgi:decaprenylphospho-beta-D-erythro-pentofuranosid-2-ulose 2-reductase
MPLKKRIVIFGATSAIAQAVARRYAEDGGKFFLVARNIDRLNAVAADLRSRGASDVRVLARDLDACESHADMVEEARAALGAFDCVLVAYGVLPNQRDCEADAAAAVRSLQTNYLSPVSLLTALAIVMAEQSHGSLGVIGSVAGDRGRQSNYVYGSSKAGIGVFVQGLRHRLWSRGVKVILIKPGLVDTPMTTDIPKGGPLWASPARVAKDIARALDAGRPAIYTPWFWAIIMAVIRSVPDAIFRRTKL